MTNDEISEWAEAQPDSALSRVYEAGRNAKRYWASNGATNGGQTAAADVACEVEAIACIWPSDVDIALKRGIAA